MSDIKDTVEEGLNIMKTEVTTQMETKASVEAVEAVKTEVLETTAAAIEAATVKSDDRMDSLEAKFAAMPAIITNKQEAPMSLWTKKEGTNDATLSMDLTKAYDDNTNVTGGRVEARGIIHSLEAGNFARTEGGLWTTSSGSIKIPLLSGITFAAEGTVIGEDVRVYGGALASTTVVIDNIVGSARFSKPSIEDITDLDTKIMSLMMQAAAKKEATDAVAVLKAATLPEVATGVAAKLPTAGNMIGKLAEMASTLSGAYLPGSKFYMSREAMAVVQASDNTGLNFDAKMGVFTIFGYPAVVVDYLASGATANDEAVYFGRMDMGLAFVSRKNLEVSRFMETSPGNVTYFGDLRSKSAIWDTSALVSLTTKA